MSLKERTAASFGFEWAKFNDIFNQYEGNFLSYIYPLSSEFFKGKLVLDAGCGAGRHSYFAAKYGASVIAIDLSKQSVRSATENLKGLNVRVIQGDINSFEYSEKFDYIFSLGVLHHLSDPQAGFNHLVSLVKPGGTISIWVYSQEDNWLAIHLYEPLRKITTKIPHEALYYLSYIPAAVVEVCNRLRLPVFSYYRKFPFKTKWNDAFDVFSAPSVKYYKSEDICRWFDGLNDVSVHYRYLNGVRKGIIGVGVCVE
jgi:2-polyprenyl-3-methyl-5-hydroxy-6-metoxy-1,4-benzoquinol methylase